MVDQANTTAIALCHCSAHRSRCLSQAEESKHKKKLERVELGPGEQDLKQWLSRIDQLKPYTEQFEAAKVTGAGLLAIKSEAALAACGISIDTEVDKYYLLLNLARVRAHAREKGQPRVQPTKTKRSKEKRPLAARDGAALGSVEMETVAGPSQKRPVQRGVC